MYEPYQQYLQDRIQRHHYRKLPRARQVKPELDFASNDYLGLKSHPALLEGAQQALDQYGVGATGARLLSGNLPLFESFEAQIARDKGTEAAILFISGYQANFSSLLALLNPRVLGTQPLVFFDKCNHASLYQAVLASGAQLKRYPHGDLDALERLLKASASNTAPKFIVTETLFGMDGDIPDLHRLRDLAQTHQTFLYLDEAHATGLYGHQGYGLSTQLDLSHVPHLIMGTFSKALGGSGAYVACHETVKSYLLNQASGLIYSTAPAPMSVGAAQAAWALLSTLDDTRMRIQQLATECRKRLVELGFQTNQEPTHLIPIFMPSEAEALIASERLAKQGIAVSCVRPPSVPPNTSRLRIAITANHTEVSIQTLCEALATL